MINLASLKGLNSLSADFKEDKWWLADSLKLNNVLPSFIHDYTQKKYWNSVAGAGNFPFTTLRSSNATMFDSQGRLVWAPHNMCTRGQDLSVGWSIGSDGTTVLSGNISPSGAPSYITTWTVASPGSGNAIGAQPVVINADMTYSIYLRYTNHDWFRIIFYSANNTTNQIRCWVNLQTKTLHTVSAGGTATGATATLTDVGDGWVRVVLSGKNTWFNGTDGSLLYASCTGDTLTTRVGNGASVEVASAIFEMTGAQAPQNWRSEFNTSGTAWYGPRFDYNPTDLTYRGLFIEPQQTNFMAKSSSNVPGEWSANFTFYTDGGNTWGFPVITMNVASTASGQFGYISGNTLSATTGSVYAVSAFVKKTNHRYVQLTTSANYATVGTPYINYDFDTDTFTENGSAIILGSGHAQILQDGWVRLQFAFTANATSSGAGVILAFGNGLADIRLPTCSNATASVQTFGHQAESNWLATSHIPTFGTSLTRNADISQITNLSWMNQAVQTWYMRGIVNKTGVNTRRMLDISDGTSTIRVQLTRGPTNTAVVSNATFAPSTTATSADFTEIKSIMRVNATNRKIATNNNVVSTDATGITPITGFTQVNIGHIAGQTPGNCACMWVKEVIYWNDSTASDAQLQAKTA